MKLCCCTDILDPDRFRYLAEGGFRFYEGSLYAYADLSEEKAAEIKAFADSLGFSGAYFNGMFPKTMRLFGSEYSGEETAAYVERALRRAAMAGSTVVTLGSGTSRMIPDGMDLAEAKEKFCALLSGIVAPAARRYGVRIGIEPLRTAECNFLNTCGEVMEIVRAVDLPEINLTVDYYHATLGGESCEAMAAFAERTVHIHISSMIHSRCYPTAVDVDELTAFFRAMQRAGYQGAASIEGNIGEDKAASVRVAAETMATVFENVFGKQ